MNIKKTIEALGFNLIEIMAAISILGIVSAVAVTQYNSYYKRTNLTASMEIAKNIKEKIMLMYINKGAFPDNADKSLGSLLDENHKKYISKINYNKGRDGLDEVANLLPPNNIVANIQLDVIKNNRGVNNTIKLYYMGIETGSVANSGEIPEGQINWEYFLSGEDYKYIGATNKEGINIITIKKISDCNIQNEYFSQGACLPCISGAECSNGYIVKCNDGYYGPNCEQYVESCDGFITGYGSKSICSQCPATATCTKGSIISCNDGYYGSSCNTLCAGLLSGAWPNSTCSDCPANTICSKGALTGCSKGYYYYRGSCVASCPNDSYFLKVDCNVANNFSNYGNSPWVYGWYIKCNQYSNFLNNNTPICDPCHTSEHYSNPSWYFCGCILREWNGQPNCYVTWIVNANTDCNSFCSQRGGYSMVGPFC